MVSRVRRKGHEKFPLAAFVACFFGKLALGGLEGCLARVDDACHEFVMSLTEGMAVLVLHDHLAVLRDCDHINPIGELHDVPSRDLLAGGKLHTLLTYGQPRPEMQDILTFNHLPRAVD